MRLFVATCLFLTLLCAACRSQFFDLAAEESCVHSDVEQSWSAGEEISAAIGFLRDSQLRGPVHEWMGSDCIGGWPQFFELTSTGSCICDMSPFMSAFIIEALSLISDDQKEALKLTSSDLDSADRMRRKAVEFVSRFEADVDGLANGTYGFWPYGPESRSLLDFLKAGILRVQGGVPLLRGKRAPRGVPFYPHAWRVPSDADSTACTYVALSRAAAAAETRFTPYPFWNTLCEWTDRGQARLRWNPAWLPPQSGAFLTWLPEQETVGNLNDVDLLVNANVLYAFGYFGRLDTRGVQEAVRLINQSVLNAPHPISTSEFSLYYPNNKALHYFIARAYGSGGVTALWPAVDVLLDDLEKTACWNEGLCNWVSESPVLATAFGCLALLASGYRGPMIQGAIGYLEHHQIPTSGGWLAEVFFEARFDNDGDRLAWKSSSLTTAVALQALCWARLMGSDHD